MPETEKHTIYTIGHSTHTIADFIAMLQSVGIRVLADIRRYPSSRKYPVFNQAELAEALQRVGIRYTHLEALGGKRKARPDSKNSRWRNDSFRGYADYMETADFQQAVAELETLASAQPTAYMCAEAVWWRCHRSLVSDYLKAKGWVVMHIMAAGKTELHPYTSPARVRNGHVYYADSDLFNP